MRNLLLGLCCMLCSTFAFSQPTLEFPLTLSGQLEDRVELTSDPFENIYYFVPFRNKRLYRYNDATALSAYTSGASAPLNGLVEKRDYNGNLQWSAELISSNGSFNYLLNDIGVNFFTPGSVREKCYEIGVLENLELVVVALSVTSVSSPTPFGSFGTQVSSPGLHLFFFDSGTGAAVGVYKAPQLSNEAIPKDVKIGPNDGYLYVAHQTHGGCSGVAVYDASPVIGGSVPALFQNTCINHNAASGDINIAEICLDPFDSLHEWVFVSGTFENSTITISTSPLNTISANNAQPFILSMGNFSSTPGWQWGETVVPGNNPATGTPYPAAAVGIAPQVGDFTPTSGVPQKGMPILVGHVYGRGVVAPFVHNPSLAPESSFMAAFDQLTGTVLWDEELEGFEAQGFDANKYYVPVNNDYLSVVGTAREDAFSGGSFQGTPAIENGDVRINLGYQTIPTGVTSVWDEYDNHPSLFLDRTDVEYNGSDFCFEYGRFAAANHTLNNGDVMRYLGFGYLDAFILRISTNLSPGINTRLANPNAPTAANNQGDYEQTGAGLPGLGQAVEMQNFASLLQAYPNPVMQGAVLQVQAQGTVVHNLRISNVAGQVIWERALLPAQNDLQVSTADWPGGIYVLSYLDALGEMRHVKIQVSR